MLKDIEARKWQTRQDGLAHLFSVPALLRPLEEGEVLVEIHAVSLNYRDIEVAKGDYDHHKSIEAGASAPIVPCSDMCGRVIQASEGSNWKVGDRVLSTFNQGHLTGTVDEKIMATGLGLPNDGVLQTHRIFPSTGLVAVPPYLSDEEAATLPIAAVTAWMSINQFRPLGHPGGEGEVILFQGTGGVSISGLQIAHAAGAQTIITSSSDTKLKRATALGADHVINYRQNVDWDSETMEFTKGRGVDIVLETGGAQTLRKSFRCIAFGGTISCIGYLSGKEDSDNDQTHVNVLALRRNVTLKGLLNGPRDRFVEMLEFYEKHQIHPVIDRIFNFDDVVEAFRYVESGSHFGKIVIRMSNE